MKLCPKCGHTKELCCFRLRPNGRPQSHCKECDKVRAQRWQADNKERTRAIGAAYDARNREHRRAKARTQRDANRNATQRWREANRGAHRAAVAAWRASNPAKARALEAKRRAVKLHAIPPWADMGAIAAIYAEMARRRAAGEDVQVDHFYPLQGEMVCGLHVETNLRVIPAFENQSKGNRLPAEAAI